LLVTLCADRTVRIWNLEANGSLPPSLDGNVSVYGSRRCTIQSNLVTVFHDGANATNSFHLTNSEPVRQTFWNQKGTHLLTVSQLEKENQHKLLECWSITNATKLFSMVLSNKSSVSYTVSESGTYALSVKEGLVSVLN